MEEMRNMHKVLVGNPEKSLVGHRNKWEDNIKMDVKEIECKVGWVRLSQARGPREHANKLQVPQKAVIF
jgi:hypothetical protein